MLNPAYHFQLTPQIRKFLSDVKRIMLRRIWLPKPLYDAIPAIYLLLGLYASYAALFMEHWSWVVPYFLLLACACLHAGILTAALRMRAYRRYRERCATQVKHGSGNS
jgi:hypothetical protein